jgi:WhiB family redox-sensing transcriptional regulator
MWSATSDAQARDMSWSRGETALRQLDAVGSLLPCRRQPELWFSDSPAEVEQAKRLCKQCPIRSLCLQGALQRQEPWGVWGGHLFESGRIAPRKRPRGRPRKSDGFPAEAAS